MHIWLVAKPWRGGLARYLHMALEAAFPGQVRWLETHPSAGRAYLEYARDKRAWRGRLLETLEKGPCDVALFVNHLGLFRDLPRRDGHVLWLTDGPRFAAGELDAYGRVFISDGGYASEVEDAAGSARFGGVVPFAHLPGLHRPSAYTGARRDLCFIGNSDPKRDDHLRRILACGYRTTIIGNYFPRHPLFWRHPGAFRPRVANERMGHIYARHRISLNVHAQVVREGTNMRTFECAGYGIPQLVEHRPGLDALFEPGQELAVYEGPDGLTETLDRLLSAPAEAMALAAAARRRVLAEHTYGHRLAVLLEDLVPASPLLDAAGQAS